MTKAILFGSIGTLAETSEMQRQAFNAAFEEAGLDWRWDADAFVEMLGRPDGCNQIRRYAEGLGTAVDADAIYARKSELLREALARGLPARPGVTNVIQAAMGMDIPLAFVTTARRQTRDAVLDALPDDIHEGLFAFVGQRDLVDAAKPSPGIYDLALDRLGHAPEDVIAVEDSPLAAEAAIAAGIPTVAFPGLGHRTRSFPEVEASVTWLTPELFGLGANLGDDTLKAAVA